MVSVSNVTEALQKKEVGQVTDGLCVFRNEKGRAICTTKIIKKGERVCQYVGELISYREGCKREVKLDPSLGSYMYFFQKGNRRLCLDATDEKKFPSFGRLINHSKKKANVNPCVVGSIHSPEIWFFALRDIAIGEEILYDYNDQNEASLEKFPWLLE